MQFLWDFYFVLFIYLLFDSFCLCNYDGAYFIHILRNKRLRKNRKPECASFFTKMFISILILTLLQNISHRDDHYHSSVHKVFANTLLHSDGRTPTLLLKSFDIMNQEAYLNQVGF